MAADDPRRNVGGKYVDEKDLIASGHCPECGEAIGEKGPSQHIEAHWPERIPDEKLTGKALERRQMLRAYKPTA